MKLSNIRDRAPGLPVFLPVWYQIKLRCIRDKFPLNVQHFSISKYRPLIATFHMPVFNDINESKAMNIF